MTLKHETVAPSEPVDVWKSAVSAAMVAGMSDSEVEALIADLDDAVMSVCREYGIA